MVLKTATLVCRRMVRLMLNRQHPRAENRTTVPAPASGPVRNKIEDKQYDCTGGGTEANFCHSRFIMRAARLAIPKMPTSGGVAGKPSFELFRQQAVKRCGTQLAMVEKKYPNTSSDRDDHDGPRADS